MIALWIYLSLSLSSLSSSLEADVSLGVNLTLQGLTLKESELGERK